MEYWQRPTTLQYHYLTQFHLMLIIILLLLFPFLRVTFCSSEINNIDKNEQPKTLESIDSATIADTSSVKEMMDNIEGSGSSNSMIEWSDDEDLGGEGSGNQNEGSGDTEEDQEHAIAPIITYAEDGRHTELIDRITTITSTTYQEPSSETKLPTRPPVIAKPPEVGSTDRSTLSVLTAFIIIIWVSLLLH